MMRKRKRKLSARQVPRRACIFCQEARFMISSSLEGAGQGIGIGFSRQLVLLGFGHGTKVYLPRPSGNILLERDSHRRHQSNHVRHPGMNTSTEANSTGKRKLIAHTVPMLVFAVLLGICGLLKTPGASLWRAAPEFWIYPLQTVLCAALLIFYWREYGFHPLRRPIFTISVALLVFVLWIAPQQFFNFPARLVGFNPDAFAASLLSYWPTLIVRFLRLIVVVPLLEEIFWRGFLLRYLISERFETVPFGTFSGLSFTIVTLGFGLSHSMADWPAALITGALYNLVAYRTRSLSSCVLTHALTNLALGLWIVATKQWGFW